MYRLLSRRIVPVAALGTLYTSKQTSFTCHAKQAAPNPDAKSEKFVTDKFETIKYWNDYKKIIIYGYHGCPYCAKVRAYLRFRGIDFEDIEINAFTKKELKETCPGYKQVPVVEIQDHRGNREAVIKDSGVIISVLEVMLDGRYTGSIPDLLKWYYTVDGKPIKERVHVGATGEVDPDRKFVQDGILHTVAPNIYPSISLSIKNSFVFQDRSERFKDTTTGYLISVFGGFLMYFIAYFCIFRTWRESPEQTKVQYLDSQVRKFLDHRKGERFIGGDFPSVADVEAYGVVNLTENTSAFPEYEKHPEFLQWYKSVERYVVTHQGMKSSDENELEPLAQENPKQESI